MIIFNVKFDLDAVERHLSEVLYKLPEPLDISLYVNDMDSISVSGTDLDTDDYIVYSEKLILDKNEYNNTEKIKYYIDICFNRLLKSREIYGE